MGDFPSEGLFSGSLFTPVRPDRGQRSSRPPNSILHFLKETGDSLITNLITRSVITASQSRVDESMLPRQQR